MLTVLRADARNMPLADNSVDLVVTSPPYFGLRSYQDGCRTCASGARNATRGYMERYCPECGTVFESGRNKCHKCDRTTLRTDASKAAAAATDDCPECKGTGKGHYDGQVGDEPTPAEFVDALIAVTRECMRVLKPAGSLWVNLGDKYATTSPVGSGGKGAASAVHGKGSNLRANTESNGRRVQNGVPSKSLIGIPWRYALRCIDDLGLILRAEVIWSKPNGLPESVTDRVRRSHEQWFHFVMQPRYFSAVDEIREAHAEHTLRYYPAGGGVQGKRPYAAESGRGDAGGFVSTNALGKLPGSVWTVKEDLWDHVLSGPMHFCPRCGRDLTVGSSPAITIRTATHANTSPESVNAEQPDSSTKCSSAQSLTDSPSTTSVATRDASIPHTSRLSPSTRTCDDETKPTDATVAQPDTLTTSTTPTSGGTASVNAACVCETGLLPIEHGSVWSVPTEPLQVPEHLGVDHFAAFPTEWPRRIIAGWSPAGVCTGCGEGRRPVAEKSHEVRQFQRQDKNRPGLNNRDRSANQSRLAVSVGITGYACDCPDTTAPTTPAVVLDPFGGTGTTAHVAHALGRHGISVDLSSDYCRLAADPVFTDWRVRKVLDIPKAVPQVVGQGDLFGDTA